MNITIKQGGDWGGYIPDEVRNGNIVLKIGNEIEITMRDDNLKELIGLTEEKIQSLWERCQKIVRANDKESELMRKFSKVMETAWQETDPSYPPSKEEFDKIMDAFFEFRNAYWNASLEAGELTK